MMFDRNELCTQDDSINCNSISKIDNAPSENLLYQRSKSSSGSSSSISSAESGS
jgi:hypothetical protein